MLDYVFPQIGITTALNNTGHTKEEMLIPVKPSGLAGLSKIRKKLNYNLNNRLNVDIEHNLHCSSRLPKRVQDGGELDASSAHD